MFKQDTESIGKELLFSCQNTDEYYTNLNALRCSLRNRAASSACAIKKTESASDSLESGSISEKIELIFQVDDLSFNVVPQFHFYFRIQQL